MALPSEELHTDTSARGLAPERSAPRASVLLLYIGLVCRRYPRAAVAYAREAILYRMTLGAGAPPDRTHATSTIGWSNVVLWVLKRSVQRAGSLLVRVARRVWWQLTRPWRVHHTIVGKIAGELLEEGLDARDPARAALVDQITQSRIIGALTMAGLARRAARLGRMDISSRAARNIRTRFPKDLSVLREAGVETFLGGDYKSSEELWGAWHAAREVQRCKHGLENHEPTFLGPTWFAAVGHIAHFDTYFKWQILTERRRKVAFNLPPGGQVPNIDLLNRWRIYLGDQLVDAVPPGDLARRELVQDEFWGLPVGDGRFRMFSHAAAWVQGEWDRRGGKPLLSLTRADHERARPFLSALGLPPGGWHVCLHVREPGFHEAWHKTNPGTRNADVETYASAAQAIVARGGSVVRMGDSSMKRMPPMEGVIDYAHSIHKSDFLDVYLSATCRFFIGTNSGLALIPPIFGVPCALTNWSPIGLPQWYPADLFIPKLCFSERLGRYLTFQEMFSSNAGWSQFQDYFVRERLRVEDSSSDDIRDLVIEMLERENGRTSNRDGTAAAMREAFEGLALHYGSYRGSRLGLRFIDRHAALFRAEVPYNA